MLLPLSPIPVSETRSERPLSEDGKPGESGDRTGLALPLSTAEGQGVVLVEAFAWLGVLVWGGGLAWMVFNDILAYRERHPRPRSRRHGYRATRLNRYPR